VIQRRKIELSGKPEERFLDPKQITAVLDQLLKFQAGGSFIFALIGGVAMQVYGSDRFTTDVDVAADTDEIPLTVVRPIKFGGKRFKLHDTPIDVIVRSDEYADLYRDALENAVELSTGVLVVSAEHLAVIKFAAGRAKDREDLHWLLANDKIDVTRTKNLTYRFMGRFGADEFEKLLDEADVRRRRVDRENP